MTKPATCFKSVSEVLRKFSRKYDVGMLGELGRGAGKGGGGGGPIREAGGPFGKIGAAREEEYFYTMQKRLLSALKGKLGEENSLREEEIRRHQAAIDENTKLSKQIDQKLEDCEKKKNDTNNS